MQMLTSTLQKKSFDTFDIKKISVLDTLRICKYVLYNEE